MADTVLVATSSFLSCSTKQQTTIKRENEKPHSKRGHTNIRAGWGAWGEVLGQPLPAAWGGCAAARKTGAMGRGAAGEGALGDTSPRGLMGASWGRAGGGRGSLVGLRLISYIAENRHRWSKPAQLPVCSSAPKSEKTGPTAFGYGLLIRP